MGKTAKKICRGQEKQRRERETRREESWRRWEEEFGSSNYGGDSQSWGFGLAPNEEAKGAARILGVSIDATPDKIKKRYRKLALEYHPDKNPGDKEAGEKFKEIANAYAVLNAYNKKKLHAAG